MKATSMFREAREGEFLAGSKLRTNSETPSVLLYRASAERHCLHKYAQDCEANEHEGQTRRRQYDCALNQVRADERRHND